MKVKIAMSDTFFSRFFSELAQKSNATILDHSGQSIKASNVPFISSLKSQPRHSPHCDFTVCQISCEIKALQELECDFLFLQSNPIVGYGPLAH